MAAAPINTALTGCLIILNKNKDMKKTNQLVIERVYNVSQKKLWEALTNREQLKKWYFDFPPEFKLVQGQEFEWVAKDHDNKQWLHRGKMLEIIPGKKLVHTWEYPGYSGSSTLTWELSVVDEKTTKLRLRHQFDVPFDATVNALKRENFNAGWGHILDTSLPEFLNN